MIEPDRVLQHADPAVLAEVRRGLARPQKELPPKFFYDVRGSELFEEITRLPEYYPTRTERALLERWIPSWIAAIRPRTLVELGAGAAVKTRVILDAMRATRSTLAYVPVDVSERFLHDIVTGLRDDYPDVRIQPVAADIADAFVLPSRLPDPTLHAFLGSTIGNFTPQSAHRLLTRTRERLRASDRFLLGVDLRKDPARIEAAYNDARGVTAEFNRNMLRVLNMEMGADFDVEAFRHRAFYDPVCHRIEMHVVAESPQAVTIPGIGTFRIDAGESIRTELSHKYDRASVDEMFAAAGLAVERWETDPERLYALVLGAPA